MPRDTPDASREHALAVLAAVDHQRRNLGLTLKQLTERVNELGWEITATSMQGLLSSTKPTRSSVTTYELLIFAQALDVSPVYLLMGQPLQRDLTTPFPERCGDAIGAQQWMRRGLSGLDLLSEFASDFYRDNTTVIHLKDATSPEAKELYEKAQATLLDNLQNYVSLHNLLTTQGEFNLIELPPELQAPDDVPIEAFYSDRIAKEIDNKVTEMRFKRLRSRG